MQKQASPPAPHATASPEADPIPMRPPYEIMAPQGAPIPFVLSSPHSGSYYPDELLAQSRLDQRMLRLSEDSYVDEIFGLAPTLGAPLLKAVYSRAYVDPNREPFELDPEMFAEPLPGYINSRSDRVAIGFGTVAREVARGISIYRGKLHYAEALSRIERIYFPYHRALEKLLDETRARFGQAILIDCHSMPSSGLAAFGPQGSPDIVLGDRFGQSCRAGLMVEAEAALKALGYKVVRNHPYAGGFITEQYGRPADGIHALQIEINRRLYMDERTLVKLPGLDRLRQDMGRLIAHLAACDLTTAKARPRDKVRTYAGNRRVEPREKRSHSA
ncbi:MAG TPA: N-formylglutamate amidohydrolase [Alphaproteobacteria bacterium]|nr:N-formylglutamate amidohydrolase [Alphaproteobacteria bacterium]